MNVEIRQLTSAVGDVLDEINLLLPVLTSDAQQLTLQELQAIINSDNTHLFVAVTDTKIVGMLTLVTYKIPTGQKAWLEDVVVHQEMQGKGIGKLLIDKAISHARTLNLKHVDLTSQPSRQAANALYQKIGFEKRETNMYRMQLK